MSVYAAIVIALASGLAGFLYGLSHAIEDHQPIVQENDFRRARLYALTAHPSLRGQEVRATSQGKAGRTHLSLVDADFNGVNA